jgi:hypothetical protein
LLTTKKSSTLSKKTYKKKKAKTRQQKKMVKTSVKGKRKASSKKSVKKSIKAKVPKIPKVKKTSNKTSTKKSTTSKRSAKKAKIEIIDPVNRRFGTEIALKVEAYKKQAEMSDHDVQLLRRKIRSAVKRIGKKLGAEEAKPKRPVTGFMAFAKMHRGEVLTKDPKMRVSEVGKELGEMWRNLPLEEKAKFKKEKEKI